MPDADLLGEGAAKVKILGWVEWSEPADWGGVNANAVALAIAESLASAAGRAVGGASLGNADIGVSGYVIENGPGVCVR